MSALRPRTRLAILAAIACLPLLLHAIPARATSGTASTSVTSTDAQTTTATTTTTSSTTTTASSTTTSTSTTQFAPPTSVQTTRTAVGDQPLPVRSATTLHAAGDPSATIVDFSFSPATITIHVGDTVTWTNQGKQPHTATANDGSFDTGTLKTGQSGSHTFTKAGTFAYICSIHPNMHGTIVVQGSSGGTGSGGGSGSGSGSSGSGSSGSAGATTTGSPTTTGTTNPTATLSSGSGLPNTGFNLAGALVAAALLMASGVLLRRRTRPH